MVEFNKGQCPKSYEEMGLCHTYFFNEFNIYPSQLSIKDDYLTSIKDFHDPILTYVALYLYRNYEIAKKYFKKKSGNNKPVDKSYNTACAVLNRWLDQEKNFYTNTGNCYFNLRWWNIYIKPLWNVLEQDNNETTCERTDSYYYKETYPFHQKDEHRCYKQEIEEHVCFKEDDMDNNSIKENCAKLSILFYLGNMYNLLDKNTRNSIITTNNYCNGKAEKINYNSVLKAEKSHFCQSLTSIITLPIIVTVLGTIFLAFFLNEFTPIGSKLQTRPKYKLRLRDKFNEEAAYKEYKTYRNNNQNTAREKNIIYYKSMNE